MTATLNRARLTATGTIATGFSYRIQGEFRTGNVGTGKASVSLTDAYIRWSRQAFGVPVGQFKTPFTREYLASIADIESLDRSTVVDSLAPKRDIGITADYQFGKHLYVTAGAFNGEGQNVTANRDSTVLGVARVTLRPIPELSFSGNVARYFGDSLDMAGTSPLRTRPSSREASTWDRRGIVSAARTIGDVSRWGDIESRPRCNSLGSTSASGESRSAPSNGIGPGAQG
jgi:hypothetical protein